MIILIADNPQINSYIASLIEAYKKKGETVICSLHNFFSSNLIPDILHIQWPERLLRWYPFSQKPDGLKIEALEERLKWYKEKGTIIIYTVDNFSSNNFTGNRLEEKYLSLVIKYADIISHYCSNSVDSLKKWYPEANSKKNIINHYGDCFLNYEAMSKELARKKLNIPNDKFLILNFANEHSFKKEKAVRRLFNSCSINSKYLLIAGNYNYEDLPPFKRYLTKLKNYLRERNTFSNKRYIYRIIHENELPIIFSASDLLFIEQYDNLADRVIAMAATYAKPVIYPDACCLKEVAKNWISFGYEKGNACQVRKAITDIYEALKNNKNNLDNKSWLEENSWENIVDLILKEVNNFNINKPT